MSPTPGSLTTSGAALELLPSFFWAHQGLPGADIAGPGAVLQWGGALAQLHDIRVLTRKHVRLGDVVSVFPSCTPSVAERSTWYHHRSPKPCSCPLSSAPLTHPPHQSPSPVKPSLSQGSHSPHLRGARPTAVSVGCLAFDCSLLCDFRPARGVLCCGCLDFPRNPQWLPIAYQKGSQILAFRGLIRRPLSRPPSGRNPTSSPSG